MSNYRDQPLKCPTCEVVMEPRVLSGSTVDTCPKCRGLWVDWFDGDLLLVVKETAPLSIRESIDVDRSSALCPRCTMPLASELFEQSIRLYRCADCAGCFVPREAFTLLLELEDMPRRSQVHGDKTQSAVERLLGVVQRLFHGEPPSSNSV